MNIEISSHAKHQNWDHVATLEMWKGNVGQALKTVISNGLLDANWVAFSILGLFFPNWEEKRERGRGEGEGKGRGEVEREKERGKHLRCGKATSARPSKLSSATACWMQIGLLSVF
jgi:hypothetical protein